MQQPSKLSTKKIKTIRVLLKTTDIPAVEIAARFGIARSIDLSRGKNVFWNWIAGSFHYSIDTDVVPAKIINFASLPAKNIAVAI